jgi:hypothetical protein
VTADLTVARDGEAWAVGADKTETLIEHYAP